MRKKLTALLVTMAVVLSSAIMTFAASGVNSDEQAMLDKFSGVVNSWATVLATSPKDGGSIANQYIAEAENALTQVDLDAAACSDLSATIDKVTALLAERGAATKKDLGAALPDVLKLVNGTSQKYGMTVSVDTKTGYATVTITREDGQQTTAATTQKAVKQTGFEVTTTAAVIALIIAVAAFAAIIVRKNHLIAR